MTPATYAQCLLEMVGAEYRYSRSELAAMLEQVHLAVALTRDPKDRPSERIYSYLLTNGPTTSKQIAAAIGMSVPVVTKHLNATRKKSNGPKFERVSYGVWRAVPLP